MTSITSKSRHTVKCPDLHSAIKPLLHSKELPVIKPPENPTFSYDNSNFDEDHGQYEGDNVDCDPTLKTRCSPYEPHLITQVDLNDLASDLNLSKIQAELLGFQIKRVESSPP
jgi:hypothetical protein